MTIWILVLTVAGVLVDSHPQAGLTDCLEAARQALFILRQTGEEVIATCVPVSLETGHKVS